MRHTILRPLPLALAVAAALAAHSSLCAAQTAPQEARPEMGAWTSLLQAPADENNAPAVGSAQVIEGSPETELRLSGEAQLRRAGTVIEGDSIVYMQQTGEVRATGNDTTRASIVREGAKFESPEFVYQIDNQTGEAKSVDYEYAPRNLRGRARCARFESADVTRLDEVLVTSCPKDNPAWWIELDELTLDEYAQMGEGRNAVLKLGGVPVMGTPWFAFPLAQGRKSGLLYPTVGWSSSKGFDLSVPYYFNIAPNYDYTLTPRVLSKRGILLGNEARFLTRSLGGTINYDWMPHDRKYGDDRYSLQADVKGGWNGFGYGVNYSRVSDDDFTDDMSTTLRESDTNVFAQDYWLTYAQKYWNTALRISKNQTIQDTSKPYEKVPQLTWNAYLANAGGFELTTKVDATRFRNADYYITRTESRRDRPDWDRVVLHQTVSYPIETPGWFITPKAQFIHTTYERQSLNQPSIEDKPSMTLPILSVDGGLAFERDLTFAGANLVQTLEPRLFYSYTPYRDQSDIPVLDSSAADMNFAQLFNESTWSGYDRIPETNQLTSSITSRIIDDATGLEWMRVAVGQRWYFNDKTVNYAGQRIDLNEQKGDFLASLGAKLTREVSVHAFGQYSWEREKMQKVSAGVRWQPRPMSTVGLTYRYNWSSDPTSDDYIDQIDFSVQWPLTRRLYVLARQNYSFYDHKSIETLAGFEYHADCWTLRTVAQRYTRDDERAETTFFLQLELTGLGSIGSNPLEELQRGIQGYQSRSPIPTSIGTYDYYQ